MQHPKPPRPGLSATLLSKKVVNPIVQKKENVTTVNQYTVGYHNFIYSAHKLYKGKTIPKLTPEISTNITTTAVRHSKVSNK